MPLYINLRYTHTRIYGGKYAHPFGEILQGEQYR